MGPALAGALYVLLVSSAALALWVRRFPGAAPRQVEVAAPWLFLAFLLGFSIYRLALVRAKKYPVGKAFFQVGAGVLFFMLLLPGTRGRYAAPPDPLSGLFHDPNPDVRSLAAEVVRCRGGGEKYAPLLVRALEDPDPVVRQEAHRSLVGLSGEDLGGPDDERAVEAWRRRYP
ncbi:MAG: HEAT repeat domain-containing protein [Myxococcales bacterium]|nr:HEAT repeat domain-containing protein [Myxococcales bacterium]